jgi:hypothetical protein
MVFSHRIAALAAVVAIPLGIAVTSYALTDSSDPRKVPPKVELETGPAGNSPASTGSPAGSPGTPVPTDETVGPPVSENPPGDDGDDSGGQGSPSPSNSGSGSPSPSQSTPNGQTGQQGDDGPGGDDHGDDG